MLFAAHQVAFGEPAARRPFHRVRHRFLHVELVAVEPEAGERPRRALRQHDPGEFLRPRRLPQQPEVEEHLLDPGGEPLRAHREDVVERRDRPDRAGVRRLAHRRQFDPVVHVRAEGVGIPVVHLAEEVAEVVRVLERREGPVHRAERRLHPRLHRLDFLFFEEFQIAIHGFVQPPVELLRRSDPFQLRQVAVAVLGEPQRSVRTRQFPPHQRDLFLPGIRDEMDMPHPPGVFVGAEPGRPGLVRRLLFQPGAERIAGRTRGFHRGGEFRARAGGAFAEGHEVARLPLERAKPGEPEVPRVRLGEVRPRLLQKRRDAPEAPGEFRRVRRGERVVVGPKIHEPVDHRAFVRRDIALRREDDHIERRVARPGAADAVVEVQPVHLGARQVPVHLLVHRPVVRRHRVEAGAEVGEFPVLTLHRRRGVVGDAVHEDRPLERAPLLEERGQVVVRPAGIRGPGGRTGSGEQRRKSARRRAGGGAKFRAGTVRHRSEPPSSRGSYAPPPARAAKPPNRRYSSPRRTPRNRSISSAVW